MADLLNSNGSDGGFRLRSLEIFNWGTFHGKIYKLQPDGRTSLLTGANGSGKTTLVDALLTLMVPSGKRFYNQSSGAEFKKERDENSYFWGYYGKSYSDADERSTIEQLRNRNDNPYSVLLACFQNSVTRVTVTLAQLRWFSNGTLKKVFIVSPYQLNITEHFGKGNFDMKGDWRKKLLKQFPKTDLYDSFKDYAARFSELFGLKEKALSLFNQTVGIKVLGDLTFFIRQQMLEEPHAEEQFKALYDHYTDLLLSHKAIKKDEKQLELLTPIIEKKSELQVLSEELSILQIIKEQSANYFNSVEHNLLGIHISDLEQKIARFKAKEQEVQREVALWEEQERQLITQKAQMNVDSQVQLLQKDVQSETEKRDRKKQDFQQYSMLAQNLNLLTDVNEESFDQNYKDASSLNDKLQTEYASLTEEKASCKIHRDLAQEQIHDIQQEISSLLGRANRIPRDLIAVRAKLVGLLEEKESELPFAGELLKVNEGSRHWEDVIERVLHSFSLRLLVPEKYIKQVNEFVHVNNLQTKLVYERIERKPGNNLMRWPTDEDSMVNKIEIKEAEVYSKWIEQQLVERFNYHCTDNLDVFYGSPKAVTSNGLIRNVNRHEKDDRPQNWNKSRYHLGWDNKESVHYLVEQKRDFESKVGTINSKLDEIQPKLQGVTNKLPSITLFTTIKTYGDINWKSHAERVQSFYKQIEDLTKSNDTYQTILKQLSDVKTDLVNKRGEKEDISAEIKSFVKEYNGKVKYRSTIQLAGVTEAGRIHIDKFVIDESLNKRIAKDLEEFDSFKNVFSAAFENKYQSVNQKVNQKQIDTINDINLFVNPGSKLLAEFPDWDGDIMDITASLKSLNQLEDFYNTVKTQRLVEHKRRFQEYMDRSMLDALTNFRTWLVNEEEKIREVIDELNVPLKRITFNKNPDTYLQLECKPAKSDQEIREFKEQLSATIPNTLEFATQKDEAYRQIVFEKIKALITELQQEEAWRRKVTDIRNWLVFSAREYSTMDNKAGQYHDNTASYSGGQKAQFTYAILGAAISHQFGIYEQGKQHRSLRFITVDEAFSKLDPEKSQFLMEFCAQLNLQILVVTPLDKINIAEPFIYTVHFVEIKNKKHSIIYNLSMQEYEARKEEFKQLAKLSDDNS